MVSARVRVSVSPRGVIHAGQARPVHAIVSDAGQRTHAQSPRSLRTIETRVVPAPLRLPSAGTCTQFERESFGALQQMMSGLPEEGQAAVWEEVADALRQFEGPYGFEAPTALCAGAGVA